MAASFPKKINKINYQVLVLLYGCTAPAAQKRLYVIKSSLGLSIHQPLTVTQFCKYEGFTLDEFDIMVERAKKF